jgi:hypothetical protein
LTVPLRQTRTSPRNPSKMPPKGSSRKRAAVDDYEDDGGFVEDAPKSKKTKAAPVKEAKSKTEASESQYWEVCESRTFGHKPELI